MPLTSSRTCLFLNHSADENAAQDEQRFSFENYVQALLEGSVPALLDVEDSVLGVAGVRIITVGLPLCCWALFEKRG